MKTINVCYTIAIIHIKYLYTFVFTFDNVNIRTICNYFNAYFRLAVDGWFICTLQGNPGKTFVVHADNNILNSKSIYFDNVFDKKKYKNIKARETELSDRSTKNTLIDYYLLLLYYITVYTYLILYDIIYYIIFIFYNTRRWCSPTIYYISYDL